MSDDAFEATASVSGKARPIYEEISTHASEEDAITALHCVDTSEYKHLRTYGKPPRRVSLYHCISHASCERRIRIVKRTDFSAVGAVGSTAFVVEEHGEHEGEATHRKRSGIDMSLKPEVDSMLRGGAGPKRIRLLLLKKYKKDKVKQAKIPDEIMLKNRKASLKKSSKNSWEISNFTVMMEWASPRMCTDPEVFFGWMGGFDVQNDKRTFAEKDLEFQNDLIIVMGPPIT